MSVGDLSGWVPLFQGADAEPFEAAVSDIVSAATTQKLGVHDIGYPLLTAYLGHLHNDSIISGTALCSVDRAVESIAEKDYPPALFGGFGGIGWLSLHTDRFFGGRTEDAYDDIDAALLSVVSGEWLRHYDLISGLVGVGVYFLERLPHPAGVAGLDIVVEALGRRAEEAPPGVTWFSDPATLPESQREQAPGGYFNLGVAHGVPGVIGLLADASHSGYTTAAATRMLRESASWVVAQARADYSYPAWIVPGEPVWSTRVAWCYGGLGVSVTLLSAARALGDDALERTAIDVALAAARRRTNSGAVDAGLCHGSAGIGHLFNRLFQATGREELRDAAVYWFQRALDMRTPGVGIAGYKPVRAASARSEPPPHEQTSFLVGATGIALAFLAATTAQRPMWDRFLLARLP